MIVSVWDAQNPQEVWWANKTHFWTTFRDDASKLDKCTADIICAQILHNIPEWNQDIPEDWRYAVEHI